MRVKFEVKTYLVAGPFKCKLPAARIRSSIRGRSKREWVPRGMRFDVWRALSLKNLRRWQSTGGTAIRLSRMRMKPEGTAERGCCRE
jgi:hypothetical protein